MSSRSRRRSAKSITFAPLGRASLAAASGDCDRARVRIRLPLRPLRAAAPPKQLRWQPEFGLNLRVEGHRARPQRQRGLQRGHGRRRHKPPLPARPALRVRVGLRRLAVHPDRRARPPRAPRYASPGGGAHEAPLDALPLGALDAPPGREHEVALDALDGPRRARGGARRARPPRPARRDRRRTARARARGGARPPGRAPPRPARGEHEVGLDHLDALPLDPPDALPGAASTRWGSTTSTRSTRPAASCSGASTRWGSTPSTRSSAYHAHGQGVSLRDSDLRDSIRDTRRRTIAPRPPNGRSASSTRSTAASTGDPLDQLDAAGGVLLGGEHEVALDPLDALPSTRSTSSTLRAASTRWRARTRGPARPARRRRGEGHRGAGRKHAGAGARASTCSTPGRRGGGGSSSRRWQS
jgi:hypothetical protein